MWAGGGPYGQRGRLSAAGGGAQRGGGGDGRGSASGRTESSGSAGAQVGEPRRELDPCPPPPSPVTARLPGSCRGEAAPRPSLGSLSMSSPPRPAAIPPLAAACRPPPTPVGLVGVCTPLCCSPGAPDGPGRAPGVRLRCLEGSGGVRGPRPPLSEGGRAGGHGPPSVRPVVPRGGGSGRPWDSARGIPPLSLVLREHSPLPP